MLCVRGPVKVGSMSDVCLGLTTNYHPKEQSTYKDITSTETSDSILGCRC